MKRRKSKGPKLLIENHILIPKHEKLSEKQKTDLLKKLNAPLNSLPVILANDPAIQKLDAKPGDIIKIVRISKTAGESLYYRGVVNA